MEYEIISQTPGFDLDMSGNPVKGTTIRFTFGEGRIGEVFATQQELLQGSVRAKIQDYIARSLEF